MNVSIDGYANQVAQRFSAMHPEFSWGKDAQLVSYQHIVTATELKFTTECLELSCESYNKIYQPDYWITRKCVAIPKALILSTIKPICHLVKAVSSTVSGDYQRGKANFFSARRDFKESWGWLVTLVDDKKGSYLVTSACFMKHCYKMCVDQPITQDNPLLQKEIYDLKREMTRELASQLEEQRWLSQASYFSLRTGSSIKYQLESPALTHSGSIELEKLKNQSCQEIAEKITEIMFSSNNEKSPCDMNFFFKGKFSVKLNATRSNGRNTMIECGYEIQAKPRGLVTRQTISRGSYAT